MRDMLEDLRAALADRYAVEDILGAGGMATVYLAEDRKHHRKVAVKVLDPELAAALGEERFLQEIQVTATLRHPHILPLLDSGEVDGLLYYVMPLVEGPSLRARIARERQLPVEEAIRIAREVAEALAFAHSRGVVHRDIKPENILLEAGHAVVADFGIARATAAAGDRLTHTGVMVGTPVYSSPEQMTGDREVDGRSDVHALGCVLWEMLTGEPPHAGPSLAAILARKTAGSPAALRELRPTVPPALEATLARALAPVPADRQQTAEELVRELSAAPGTGRPQAAASPGAVSRRRRRGVRGALLVAAGLVVAGAAGWWWTAGGGQASADPLANRVVVLPYQNETGDPALDPVGRMVADWITEGLARTPGVRVVPSSMVLEAVSLAGRESAGRGPGPAEVAELTRAGLAVTGSYYLRGGDLEFHSEVVDVASGTPFAAIQPVRGSARAFEGAVDSVRAQVMGALATRFSETIGWEIPPSVQPPIYEAFRAYSRGMEHWARGDYASATDALLRAYALDTTYVRSLMLALSAAGNADQRRADSLRAMLLLRRDGLSPYDRYRLDWSEARRRGDRSASLAAARAGTELVPYGTLHSALVLTLVAVNRPGEALTNLEAIVANNPMAGRWYVIPDLHGEILHILGDHERELQVVREAHGRIAATRHYLLDAEGRALAALGRADELSSLVAEIATTPSSVGIDPGEVLLDLAGEARAHGLDALAGETLERALAWHREQPAAYRESFEGRELQGRLLYRAGRWDEAAEVVQTLPADSAHIDVLGRLGTLAARRDRPDRARVLSDTLSDLGPAAGRTDLWRARIAALLGERDAAVERLRRAFAEGLAYGLWLHADPDLEGLRGYPAYEEVVRPEG